LFVELQDLLDMVCFSEVRSTDIRNHSVGDVAALIKSMQLMLEYLLYCQEAQLSSIHEMKIYHKKSKKQMADMQIKLAASKEDIRIYQRQVSNMQQTILRLDSSGAEGHRVIRFPTNENPEKNTAVPDGFELGAILRHEQETRTYVKQILEEQREAFLLALKGVGSQRDNEADKSAALNNTKASILAMEDSMFQRMELLRSELAGVNMYTKRESSFCKEYYYLL
jgi:hypothetical protein